MSSNCKQRFEWTECQLGSFIKNDATAIQFDLKLLNADGTAYDGSSDDYEFIVFDTNNVKPTVTIADTNWTKTYSAGTGITTLAIPGGDVDNATGQVLQQGRARLKNTTKPRVEAEGPWIVLP